MPINAVAVREKNTDNAVLGNTDDNADNKGDAAARPVITGSGDLDEVVFLVQPGDTVRKVKVRTDIRGYQLH
ncbi:hypothetical protein ACQ86N_42100 [Puia sp. P3]|uniref:hypothetical protein n=1 Tax=Puia sp. P3 TaxID=3423952 RepID=UPI003D678137